MVTWAEFEAAAPELAARGRARFDATGLALVGTLRADGWPRISPVEPLIFDGELALGMMWQSRKARDLMRDSRLLVHSTVSDKAGTEGEFKVYGRARAVEADRQDGRAVRERYCTALRAAIDWAPEGDEWHLWLVDIDQVGWFLVVGDSHQTEVWRPEA